MDIQWLITKMMLAIGALIGSATVSMFWTPPILREKSRLLAGNMIGGGSVGSAIIFGGFIMQKLGLTASDIDSVLFVGGCIGILAMPVLGWIGNYLHDKEADSIIEVARDIKDEVVK